MSEFDEQLKKFRELTDLRKEHERIAAEYGSEAFKIEQRLVEQFAATGTQNIRRDGKTFYLATESSVTIKADCKADAVDAARGLGLDDLITVQPQRFASWAKEMIANEGKLPDELANMVNVFEQKRLRIKGS